MNNVFLHAVIPHMIYDSKNVRVYRRTELENPLPVGTEIYIPPSETTPEFAFVVTKVTHFPHGGWLGKHWLTPGQAVMQLGLAGIGFMSGTTDNQEAVIAHLKSLEWETRL